MNLEIIDIVIILIILLGGVIGFKEGAIKKLTSAVGLVVILIVSFILKNKISVYFYENLPFIRLWGVFKGIQVLNIIFYEMVAFLVIASILTVVYRVLLGLTGLIERLLKATVILSIPSKIIGFFVGLIENYIWVYIILFILTLPVINFREAYTSKTATFILNETPILSKYTSKTLKIYNSIYKIIENREGKTNSQINEEAMDVMLEYEIITVESAEKLIKENKVEVDNDDFLLKYKKRRNNGNNLLGKKKF